MESIFSQPGDSMYGSLSKAAARFALSIVRSGRYLTEAYAEALFQLLTADNLWTLCLILAAWAIATLIGGPLALAVDGFLIAYGLYSLYEQLAATWTGLRTWAQSSYHASSEEQIEEAARHFAATVAAGSLELLAVLVTHRVFAKVQVTLSSRFSKPTWLEDELAAAKQFRTRRQTEDAPGQNPRRPSEPVQGQAGLRRLTEPAAALGRAAGVSPLARGSWTLPVGILGGALALSVAVALAAAAMGGTHGRKR